MPVRIQKNLNRRGFLQASSALALASSLPVFAAGKAHAAVSADINSPTGSNGVIAIDKRGAFIRFFDPKTFAEIKAIPVEKAPHEVAISPDHKMAYVPIYGDGIYAKNPNPGKTILFVDLDAMDVVDQMDVSPHRAPHGVMVDRQGMLYVTCDESRKFLVIDPRTKTIEAAIDTVGTSHFGMILPDGSKAFLPNKNDKTFVSVIDIRQRKMIGAISAPNGSDGLGVAPDGSRVMVCDIVAPRLIEVDPADDTVLRYIPLNGDGPPFRARYNLDGSRIMVSRRGDTVTILDAADPVGRQWTFGVDAGPMGFAFAPDGHTAVGTNHNAGKLTFFDLSGDEPRITKVIDAGVGIETLAYY